MYVRTEIGMQGPKSERCCWTDKEKQRHGIENQSDIKMPVYYAVTVPNLKENQDMIMPMMKEEKCNGRLVYLSETGIEFDFVIIQAIDFFHLDRCIEKLPVSHSWSSA